MRSCLACAFQVGLSRACLRRLRSRNGCNGRTVGVTLTEMNQIPALLFPRDLPNRRRVEAVILTVRQNIADQCLRRAEEEEGKGSP